MPGQFAGLDRRSFLRIATTGAAAVAGGIVTVLASCHDTLTGVDDEDSGRALLRQPGAALASALTLTAAPGAASIGDAAAHAAWLFNGEFPGPTIRARRGEAARIRLLNALPEQAIVHWHGLVVPESADGHPRQAVSPGEQYDYAFPIVQRAGTFWYHPHAHHRPQARFIAASPGSSSWRMTKKMRCSCRAAGAKCCSCCRTVASTRRTR